MDAVGGRDAGAACDGETWDVVEPRGGGALALREDDGALALREDDGALAGALVVSGRLWVEADEPLDREPLSGGAPREEDEDEDEGGVARDAVEPADALSGRLESALPLEAPGAVRAAEVGAEGAADERAAS